MDLREYINSLNDEFVKATGSHYYNLSTGEQFTETEVNKYISMKIEEFNLHRNAEVSLIARENGFELGQRLVNKRSKNKSKKLKEKYDGGDFNIYYRKEMENFMALKLTLVEEGVFSRLCKFLHYPTNCVMMNGNIPSTEMLLPIMDLKERAFRGHLKTLQDKGVIKLVQSGHKKAIYINPKYCATGKDLDIDTLKMFDLLECDNDKIASYL